MNQKELLLISITIFCTIVAWIVADLYHIATSEQKTVEDKRYLQPIDVNLDSDLLKELEVREALF